MREIQNPFTQYEGYNCFGCSPGNLNGLRLRFFEDGDLVVSEWDPEPQFQGYSNILHGGIQATLADEIASWTVYVKAGTAGVTYKLDMKFKKTMYLNRGKIRLVAKVREIVRRIASIDVDLIDAEGKVCASALVDYYIYPLEKAREGLYYPGKDAFFKKQEK